MHTLFTLYTHLFTLNIILFFKCFLVIYILAYYTNAFLWWVACLIARFKYHAPGNLLLVVDIGRPIQTLSEFKIIVKTVKGQRSDL